MHKDDIIPYLDFEVRRHRDSGWVWPARDDNSTGPGIWGFLFVLALVTLAVVAGWE